MNLYLDIETIPTQRDAVRDWLSTSLRDQMMIDMDAICAPSNYKDPEKIAAYCADKRKELQDSFAQSVADKINATSLDGAFGQVFCIGWACDNQPTTTVYGMNEKYVLTEFAKLLRIAPKDFFTATVVGHNVSSFDLRFLTQRYIVNGIRPPQSIARAAQAKPWEADKVYDTMIQWAGAGGRIALDKLCMALSVESPKGELDGSKVWQWVQDGRLDEVAQYCERDVEAVRQIHRRMTFGASEYVAEALAA